MLSMTKVGTVSVKLTCEVNREPKDSKKDNDKDDKPQPKR